MKTILDIKNIKNKKFLLRCDLNVPVNKNGAIQDTTRIIESLPTIKYIIDNGGKVAICSHFGRPDTNNLSESSLKPVAEKLSEIIKKDVVFLCNPFDSIDFSKDIFLLENTRFFAEEKENNLFFSAMLAKDFDYFINDAFGTIHRKHASTLGVTNFLPSYAGLLLSKEIEVLSSVLEKKYENLVIAIGGSKMETKIGIVENFINKAKSIIIGGGIANTFLKARGIEIGGSLCENSEIDLAKNILKKAKENNCEIILPVDFVVSEDISNNAKTKIKENNVENNEKILDIGPKSQNLYCEKIKSAEIFIWNGPAGVFEFDPFKEGTIKMLNSAKQTKAILGGGDTINAINKFDFDTKDFYHVSTGGGAMLKFLEGEEISALSVFNK